LDGHAAAGPYQQQAGKTSSQPSNNELGSVAVLNAGRVNYDGKKQVDRIDNNMSFAAVYLLARVVTVAPPFWAVLTL